MDSTIIAAIIAAVATIVAALIGISNRDNPNKGKKRIAFLIAGFLLFLAVILVIYIAVPKNDSGESEIVRTSADGSVIIITGGENNFGSDNKINKAPNPASEVSQPSKETAAPVATPAPTTAASKYPNPPDDSLIDEYGPDLHYPDRTEYLDECKTMYIKAPKGYSVYAYSSHRTDRRQIAEIRDGEEVTVVAQNKNNGLSCVIVESMQRAMWVTSTNLASTPD